MTLPLFAYGTLQDEEILAAVLGRKVDIAGMGRIRLQDHAAVYYPGRPYPALVAHIGGVAEGVLVTGLGETDLDHLDAFEGDEYRRAIITLASGATAWAYLPTIPIPPQSPPWTLQQWQSEHRTLVIRKELHLARKTQ